MDHHIRIERKYPYWFAHAIRTVTDPYRYDYLRIGYPGISFIGDLAADADDGADRDVDADSSMQTRSGDAGASVPRGECDSSHDPISDPNVPS